MSHRPDHSAIRKWLKIGAMILSVLMVRVWENVQSQRLERRLIAMRTEADRLTYENGRLQMQIHQYESSSNLETLARNKYAMAPLDAAHRVAIEP